MPLFDPIDLARWSGHTWPCMPSKLIAGISINTQTLKLGDLFFALQGSRSDGHAFVRDAFMRGAAGAVVRADFAKAHPTLPLLVVDDPAQALRAIAAGYRQTLRTEFIAVTGSVGKTTTKEMLADLLAARGPTARSRGNFNNDLGLPLSLLGVEPTAQFGVFELGMNHPGELSPLVKLLRPQVGVVTTVGPVHLEFFKSVRAIADEKAEVLRALPANGLAVLAADDDWFDVLRVAAPCRVVTVALEGGADYLGQLDMSHTSVFTVTERATGETVPLENALPGEHMVRNALLAVAVAREHGVGWAVIRDTMKNFKPVAMRWEQSVVGGIAIINDAYNASPLSMRAALKTFAKLPAMGVKWLVLGGMRELGPTTEVEHRELGGEIAAGEWAGLVTVGELGGWIADGACEAGMDSRKIFHRPTCTAAACALLPLMKAGDAVLLKASRSEKLEVVIQDLTERLHSA